MTHQTITRMLVTKAQAQTWLAANTGNRTPGVGRVNRLVAVMEKGEWDEENPATIAISISGRLLDGQHRLMAFVKQKVMATMYFWVALNVPDSSQKVMDCGWGRTLAQRMSVDKDTAAVIQWLFYVDGQSSVAPGEFDDCAKLHADGLAWLHGWSSRRGFGRTQFRTATMLLWEVDHAKGEDFRTVFLADDVSIPGHPADTLRRLTLKWLINRNMPTQSNVYKYALSATKARLEGRTLMKVYRLGDKAEA